MRLDVHQSVSALKVRQRAGVAAVEFAVVLPMIVGLLLGMWEVGRLIEVQQVIANAAREGARQAAGGQLNYLQVQTVVINYLTDAGIPVNDTNPDHVVTIQNQGFSGNPTPPDNNPQNATQLDELLVTVNIPFGDVRWIALDLFATAGTTLTGQATWSSIRDKAYPDVSYPPPE